MQVVFHRVGTVLLIVTFPLFFWWGPQDDSARSMQEFWNLGHTFFFCLLTLFLFHHRLCRNMPTLQKVAFCLAVTALLGAGIELIQHFIPERNASITDLYRDISGSMIALFFLTIKATTSNFIRVTGILCGSAILALTFFSLIQAIRDEIAAWQEFPILADFEHEYDLRRWEVGYSRVARVASPVRTGKFALKIDFSSEAYSWIALAGFPRKWVGYTAICFSVYDPDGPVELNFRVHDKLHRRSQEYSDRYNARFFIVQGWNDIRVELYDILNAPKGRLMDMNNVEGIVFFVMGQNGDRTLYLDSLRLE